VAESLAKNKNTNSEIITISSLFSLLVASFNILLNYVNVKLTEYLGRGRENKWGGERCNEDWMWIVRNMII